MYALPVLEEGFIRNTLYLVEKDGNFDSRLEVRHGVVERVGDSAGGHGRREEVCVAQLLRKTREV